jgi:hypothetical protein
MSRALLLLAAAALAFPGAAAAKGPSVASIDGPGSGGIDIGGSLAPGSPLAELSERAGFSPAVFRQTPDPMRADRPSGDLGPKYTITYTVPGPEGETFVLKQDAYPYATPVPVTYMRPGQKVFRIKTRGGWFVADPSLKATLVAAGLPVNAPSGSASDDTAFFSAETLSMMAAAALLLAAATVVFLRRRERPAVTA